jgi:iron complex transport system ATP-binding protein
MIRIENISKSYGSLVVVDNVTAVFPQGQITALVGSNGAGKSTLLNIIGRLIPPTNGNVMIQEKELSLWNSRELAQQLAILKQSNSTHLQITVEDLVQFGRFPYSQGRLTPEDKEAMDFALKFTDLSTIRSKYIHELSGGQRQRAYIAMIIAQDSPVILLDEPLNNLDMKHSVQVMELLKRLCHEKGKTIITVMHDINLAAAYASHLFAMKNGKLIFSGTSEEGMTGEILSKIFDLPCNIYHTQGRPVCLYY